MTRDDVLYRCQIVRRRIARVCFFGSRMIGNRRFLWHLDETPRKRLRIRLEEPWRR